MDDELRQAQERRLEVLNALVKALDDLPALLAIVTGSTDGAAAAAAVAHQFGVSPRNAVAILDQPVGRMSEQGRARIVEERDALAAELAAG